ncbi:hypothetical protein IPH19_03250 [Candidatus Uhrbacteria bacterium]|nr:MAG: hypothetical protein IPH19_03250 [Candidatus Uhrbacteria bacterium]
MDNPQPIDLEQDLVDHYHTDEFTSDVDLDEVENKLRWEACRGIREKGKGSQGDIDSLERNPAFAEHDGRLYFWFKSEYRGRKWGYIGRIPTDVQKQGEEAIKLHVEARKNAKLDPIKKQIDEHDRFCENSNVEVTVEHDGQILRGKILSGDGRYYALRMESPYQVDAPRLGGYNQWSAQSGVYMFSHDSEGKLCYSEHCLNGAKDELIRMYKAEKNRRKHPNIISLADRLNRG